VVGEARKRRLALIKGGHAEVAKKLYTAPSELVSNTFLATSDLDAAITERFEKQVNKEHCPTRADFLEKLVVAGLKSFDNFAAKQQAEDQHPLIATPTTEEVIKLS
jgi:hypothetical protein